MFVDLSKLFGIWINVFPSARPSWLGFFPRYTFEVTEYSREPVHCYKIEAYYDQLWLPKCKYIVNVLFISF